MAVRGGVLAGEDGFEFAVSFGEGSNFEDDEGDAEDHDEVDGGPTEIEDEKVPVFIVGNEFASPPSVGINIEHVEERNEGGEGAGHEEGDGGFADDSDC